MNENPSANDLVKIQSLKISQTAAALAGAIVLSMSCAGILRLGDLETYSVETMALGLAAGTGYLIALWALANAREQRRVLWIILAGAMICRALLLPLEPKLSNDVHRYRWDAKVQAAGLDPYTIRPDDPRLNFLRDEHWRKTSGPDMPTIYPPLLELAYRPTLKYLQTPMGFKWAFAAADFLLLILMAVWVRANGARNYQLAIYAWNPLVLLEYSGTGHNDALAMIAVVGALWLWEKKRLVPAAACLAAATMLKIFPVVLFPCLLLQAGRYKKKDGWLCAGVAAALMAACAWPFRSAWPGILDTFAYWGRNWTHNNAGVWALLEWFSGSRELATGIGLGIVAGLAMSAAARRTAPVRAAILLFGSILLLSQNAFSWYFTWMVPLLAMSATASADGDPPWRVAATERWVIPWLLLTVLQVLSNHVLIDYQAFGVWHFKPWMLWLEYGPFFGLVLWKSLEPQINTD
ncbi:MAG: DUF2029 domain-containing protein [Acidobacteria bacterium]|nr:DUF2029 domain-containing protein [Acidobacteriota bacterium]